MWSRAHVYRCMPPHSLGTNCAAPSPPPQRMQRPEHQISVSQNAIGVRPETRTAHPRPTLVFHTRRQTLRDPYSLQFPPPLSSGIIIVHDSSGLKAHHFFLFWRQLCPQARPQEPWKARPPGLPLVLRGLAEDIASTPQVGPPPCAPCAPQPPEPPELVRLGLL